MTEKNSLLKKLRKIAKIISWAIITVLVIIIMFLLFIVLSTKISQKMGKQPYFSLYTIISPSMTPNLNVYDVVFVSKTNTKKLKKGDIISFYVKNSRLGDTPVTHRIIDIQTLGTGENSFQTKGDYNLEPDEWRYPVTESDVVGKVLFKIPSLGRLQFFLTSKKGWFMVVLVPALGIIAFDLFKLIKLLILRGKLLEEDKKNIENNINNSNLNINNSNDQTNYNSNVNETHNLFNNLNNSSENDKEVNDEANYDD
ncbi:MAG: signal peptidase I [Bacilli bacterium]|nr:signal peptidase I [Bacilli bacterium]